MFCLSLHTRICEHMSMLRSTPCSICFIVPVELRTTDAECSMMTLSSATHPLTLPSSSSPSSPSPSSLHAYRSAHDMAQPPAHVLNAAEPSTHRFLEDLSLSELLCMPFLS